MDVMCGARASYFLIYLFLGSIDFLLGLRSIMESVSLVRPTSGGVPQT
ncbi:unnamed protein product [Amoebophrya sp. A25]|nr:unnamed protein product [Amoebophrya sp. A25]|eukprot:GSA25T00000300001.1